MMPACIVRTRSAVVVIAASSTTAAQGQLPPSAAPPPDCSDDPDRAWRGHEDLPGAGRDRQAAGRDGPRRRGHTCLT